MKFDPAPSSESRPLNDGDRVMRQLRTQKQAGGVDTDTKTLVDTLYANKGKIAVAGKRGRVSTYRRGKRRYGKTYRKRR
jgi:hypothetical protein